MPIDLLEQQALRRKNGPVDLLAARGLAPKIEENPWISGINAFNYPFEKLAHGVLQPLFERGYLGENVSNASKNMARRREEELLRSQEVNPLAAAAGGALGEIGINIPGVVAGGGGLLSSILSGALGGGIRGGAEYVNPEESRLENALYKGAEGGLFGAIPAPAIKSGKYLKNIPEAINSKALASNILAGKKMAEKTSKDLFNSFINEGQRAGIKVEIPKFPKSILTKEAPTQYKKQLDAWLKNPDIKNTHALSKATGKLERRLGNKIQAGTITTPEENTYHAVKKMNTLVKRNMENAIEKSGRKDLHEMLKSANRHYVEEVLPHRNSLIIEHLGKPGKKGSTPSDFLRDLSKQKLFRKELAHKYPAVGVRKSLPFVLGATGIGGVGGHLGLYSKLLDLLNPLE